MVLVHAYSAFPREVPCLLRNPRSLKLVRMERKKKCISEYKLAFPETAWDMGYLTHLYFHPHLIKSTKAEWTLKVKGETVLDHVMFWFGYEDRQVKTRRSPFSLWDLAGKAHLNPIRKEAEWQFKCH